MPAPSGSLGGGPAEESRAVEAELGDAPIRNMAGGQTEQVERHSIVACDRPAQDRAGGDRAAVGNGTRLVQLPSLVDDVKLQWNRHDVRDAI